MHHGPLDDIVMEHRLTPHNLTQEATNLYYSQLSHRQGLSTSYISYEIHAKQRFASTILTLLYIKMGDRASRDHL